MNIHEHQSKELFRKYGLPTPRGRVAFSVEEALQQGQELAAETGSKNMVVKAQIHAGGRGKAGGVKLAHLDQDFSAKVNEIFGMTLVTPQTGQEGKVVKRLLVEEATPPVKEFYFSLVLDRTNSCVSLIASSEGGTEIEELAVKEPEKILRCQIDPQLGWQAFYTRRVSQFFGLNKVLSKQMDHFLKNLYELFWKEDASQVEINPLCIVNDPQNGEEKLVALDAKLNFDENAEYRHPYWKELSDPNEENEAEKRAADFDLNFIALDGNIGCMVNGAGLAMATMDIIKHFGGEPANFLDVGGGATAEKVREAFKIILNDEKVQAIFVNIFGGIMKCDVIAEGVIAAAKEIQLDVPLIVRLEGTNVEKGKELLNQSGLNIQSAKDMADGARLAVEATKNASEK